MNVENVENVEYVIAGDTEEYRDCLVCVVGASFDVAKYVLNRMLNNPTEHDQLITKGHTNLRIEKVHKDDCWWNYNCD